MSASPRIVCVACATREVGMYEIACTDCRPQLEAAGLVNPSPKDDADKRIQIGPTDV